MSVLAQTAGSVAFSQRKYDRRAGAVSLAEWAAGRVGGTWQGALSCAFGLPEGGLSADWQLRFIDEFLLL